MPLPDLAVACGEDLGLRPVLGGGLAAVPVGAVVLTSRDDGGVVHLRIIAPVTCSEQARALLEDVVHLAGVERRWVSIAPGSPEDASGGGERAPWPTGRRGSDES